MMKLDDAKITFNPIFKRHFLKGGMLSSQGFDGNLSSLFKKQLIFSNLISGAKPSSMTRATTSERIGDKTIHHVLWLFDEKDGLRDSISYKELRRAPKNTLRTEKYVKDHLENLYKSLARLRNLCK